MKIVLHTIAVICAALAALFIDEQNAKDSLPSLTPLVSILLAGLFPTMLLVVGTMQSGTQSVSGLEKLHAKLKSALDRLYGVYVLGVVTVGLSLIVNSGAAALKIYLAGGFLFFHAMVFVLIFLLVQFLGSIAIVLGTVKEALDIKTDIAIEEAKDRLYDRGKLETKMMRPSIASEGYGRKIDFPTSDPV